MASLNEEEIEVNKAPARATYMADADKIPAPSIEQVNSNPEELRELRGDGRYFGVGDPDADLIKCSACSQRGHIKRNCPHVICSYCGVMDDHYSKQCPTTILCSNCGEKGHYRNQCDQRLKKIFCGLCNSKQHPLERCPSVWRSYISNGNKTVLPMHKVFCYNCAGKGHFGDQCKERRSSRVPNIDGSAFSGENLPKKERSQYFSVLKDKAPSNAPSGPRKRGRDDDMYEEEERSHKRPHSRAPNFHAPPRDYSERFDNRSQGSKNRDYRDNRDSRDNGFPPRQRGRDDRDHGLPPRPNRKGYVKSGTIEFPRGGGHNDDYRYGYDMYHQQAYGRGYDGRYQEESKQPTRSGTVGRKGRRY